jgi:hypothetical protein
MKLIESPRVQEYERRRTASGDLTQHGPEVALLADGYGARHALAARHGKDGGRRPVREHHPHRALFVVFRTARGLGQLRGGVLRVAAGGVIRNQ